MSLRTKLDRLETMARLRDGCPTCGDWEPVDWLAGALLGTMPEACPACGRDVRGTGATVLDMVRAAMEGEDW